MINWDARPRWDELLLHNVLHMLRGSSFFCFCWEQCWKLATTAALIAVNHIIFDKSNLFLNFQVNIICGSCPNGQCVGMRSFILIILMIWILRKTHICSNWSFLGIVGNSPLCNLTGLNDQFSCFAIVCWKGWSCWQLKLHFYPAHAKLWPPKLVFFPKWPLCSLMYWFWYGCSK